MLVTELGGRLRIIRDGVLDPTPLAGVPEANTRLWRGGLMDVVLHPGYADNKLIYLTYSKSVPDGDSGAEPSAVSVALARGRFDGGTSLTEGARHLRLQCEVSRRLRIAHRLSPTTALY